VLFSLLHVSFPACYCLCFSYAVSKSLVDHYVIYLSIDFAARTCPSDGFMYLYFLIRVHAFLAVLVLLGVFSLLLLILAFSMCSLVLGCKFCTHGIIFARFLFLFLLHKCMAQLYVCFCYPDCSCLVVHWSLRTILPLAFWNLLYYVAHLVPMFFPFFCRVSFMWGICC